MQRFKTIDRALVRCVGCMILLLLSTTLFAQNATLTGKVTDAESGDTLPGANVVVTAADVQTGAASSVTGEFVVTNLPPGTYVIKVSFIGYETATMANVTLAAGDSKTFNFALELTGINANPITVSASRRSEKVLQAPASISVLEARELTQEVAPSSDALLRNVTGLDMAQTGIDRREIVLRGFNNAFSGATYILTDYRRAAVPSLDVNLHSVMPNMAIDLEKVEIVRGPASALYGAGVDAGVIHYLSKTPFEHSGTTASFSGGERTSFAGHFRHANVIGEKFGYKITGQYAQADDWDYNINDPQDSVQLINPVNGDTTFFDRDYQKLNINGLMEFRLKQNVSLIFNGGYSHLDATVLSGIGTVQADNYGYVYGQARLQAGKFFAQAYLNKNDAGDSFVYGQLQPSGQVLSVVDNSTVLNLQAQYDLDFMEEKEQVIVGVDYDRTAPKTNGTIYGRNENDDLISEFGVYAQSLTKISPKLDLTLAARLDKNNIEDGVQISPRAAIVFKPTAKHNFRVTYNRAYALPGGNSLFLDIIGREVPLAPGISIIQRGRGSRDGFTFNTATQGGVIRASGLLPVPGIFGQLVFQYSGAGVPTQNVPLAAVYGVAYAGLAALPPAQIQALLVANGFPQIPIPLIQTLVAELSPTQTQVSGLGTSVLTANPVDVEPLKSTITHSIEAGYKGLLGDKVLLALDGYYTQKKNFVSGVTQLTPIAVFGSSITTELAQALAAGIAGNPDLAALAQLGVTPQQVAAVIVGLAQQRGITSLPVGVVQADGVGNQVPGEITGAYRNFGDVDFWGLDATLQIAATSRLDLFGNVSFVNDDFFDNKELNEPDSTLSLALNASKFKAKGGFSYSWANGLSVNAAGRYTKGFPVNSGPYIGEVDNYFLLDLGAGYDFGRLAPGMRVDITVQNLLNNEHREFVGAPEIGRLSLARITYSF